MNILKINMTKKQIKSEPVPKGMILGGRGLIDYVLTENGSPSTHPLSEESLFVVAPGFLSGTSAPQSGRLSVGGKSPLTGGIKEANVGGTGGHKLGRLGIQGIVVEGKAKEWQILKIDSKGATLEPAGNIVGLMNYAACDKLRERYGDKIGIIIIGVAGEMKMANSSVQVTDTEGRPSRAAGRGGVGAMMGAKGLKAIVVDDTGTNWVKPKDEAGFKAAAKAATDYIQKNAFTEILRNQGTTACLEVENQRGGLPSLNHRQGFFKGSKGINGEKLAELCKGRGGKMAHGCLVGCVVRCSPIFHDTSGKHVTSGFEYETICMLGANLGIDDLDSVARMDRKCDEIGLDTIEMGCTIGILNDAGLFNFGDSAKAEAYIDEIAKGTPFGRILGSGMANVAKIYGIDRVAAVKGQGIPAHAARPLKGWGLTYATSPQGADHTAGVVDDEQNLSPNGQVEKSRGAQIVTAALDASGFCMFTLLHVAPKLIADMVSSFYGIKWTEADYMEMGKKMLLQERAYNYKAGIGPEADGLPDWMTKEPLPQSNAVFDVPRKDVLSVFNFE